MISGVRACRLCASWAGMYTQVPARASMVSLPSIRRASPFTIWMIAGVEAVCSDSSWPTLNANRTTLT